MKKKIAAFVFVCLLGALLTGAYWQKQENVIMAIALEDALRAHPPDVKNAVLHLSERKVRGIREQYKLLFRRNIHFWSIDAGSFNQSVHIKISVKKLRLDYAEVLCGDFHVGLSGSTYILYFTKLSGEWTIVKKELYEIS